MEKYESKQERIFRPAMTVYETLSDFSRFTPLLADKVEGWQATPDTCSFKVQGFTVKLRIIEREPGRHIKITGDEGAPMEFNMWIQMKELAPDDTRIRLVLHAELNMMMKMMVGKKLREGLDKMVEGIANGFNQVPFTSGAPSVS